MLFLHIIFRITVMKYFSILKSLFSKKYGKFLLTVVVVLSFYKASYHLNRVKTREMLADDDVIRESRDATKHHTKAQCKALLSCLTNGTWTMQKGLKSEEIRKRNDMDAYMLEYQGWPRKLSRQDLKCGKGYSLDGQKNNDLMAICDGQSEHPCCNENKGACGNTPEYCNCESCTNFTKYLPAELAEWNTFEKHCRIEKLGHDEACEFFNNHISEMVFVGDSLTRHFFTALAILLTNNFATGALRTNIDKKQKQNCQGEFQFIDSGKYNCHGSIAREWEDLQNVCGETPVNFKVYLKEAYNYNLFPKAKKAVKSLLNKTGSIVVMNVGLHMSLNSYEVIENYVGPLVDMVAKNGSGWPKLIWHELHSVDNFLRSEIKSLFSSWNKYNDEMAEYFKKVKVDVLQMSRLTKDILSYDFRHFGLGGNMMKVQVLLNYLKTWFEDCRRS